MKSNSKKKSFDAAAMMREIREKLSKQYSENPNKQDEDLAQIRKKYGIKLKRKA